MTESGPGTCESHEVRRQSPLEILQSAHAMTDATAALVARFAEVWDVSEFHAILQCHAVTEAILADHLSRSLGLERVFHCRSLNADPEALAKVPYRQAKEWEILPLGRTESGGDVFEVVVADPTRDDRVCRLTDWIGGEFSLAVAERSDIVGAIDELYPLSQQLPGLYASMCDTSGS